MLDQITLLSEAEPFSLNQAQPTDHEEAVMLAIIRDMNSPTDKRPLQCVTFKQPLPEYFRLKEVCQRWKLKYTNVIRIFLRMAIHILESPNGQLLELLEKHRESEIEKERLRKEAHAKRFAEIPA
ncbi:hypothetical protein [Edaphobacter modestus]|uniref:Uncharacterized protein n=1 Tax=Edaphobacter modestus TaxID=388466 RepID=A0A4Q7XXP4_9BACT|nr:hypothetical protein [Edaphobacter modestus]RZU29080.1 hypothetical protein BDD14_6675 [Edaphobacter modestus]